MALSLFQDAQAARGLAAARALTGEQHDDERNLSPPISNNNAASIYSGLLSPTESAMRMLTPHFQTAALLGIPISSLASSSPFFPTHPLLMAWAQSSTANSSPPTSPISPALKSVAKKIATNNNHIVSTTTADLGRKGAPRRRQISVRKDIISPPARFDTPAADAPISPPTSGSSPQSTGSAEHATMLTPAASDHKSASSDDSVPPFATPLDDDPMDCERRHRKSRDIRQIIRLPPQFVHLQPEQTEPEDLSMHSPRSSPPSPPASHDDDLDELDDAAALYISRQRHPDDSLY
uniref:Uncharacterized protein n=2 Tax=Lutzomyia longipalpis TaxID=7200 RepID=A0A1B0CF31_LUTLO